MKWGSVQESCHPVGENVYSGTGVVNVRKDIARLAFASIVQCFLTPGSSVTGSVYCFSVRHARTYSTGIQLIKMKIKAIMFMITNVAITTYCT